MPINIDTYLTEKEVGGDGVNRLLNEYLPNLPVSSQVLISRLLSTDGTNQLKDYLANGIADTVRATSSSIRNKNTITVGEILTSLDERKLCDLFPELTIKFTRSNYTTHPFAAASRRCERLVLLGKAGYSKVIDYAQTLKEANKDVFVKEVGGDPTRSIRGKEGHIHHCAPILDSYDQSRFTQRRHLASLYRSDPLADPEIKANALNYLKKSELLLGCKQFCFTKSQHCAVTAEVLIALHSVYDMHPSEFADSMVAANASVAYGSFMYSPIIFLKNKGVLQQLGARYEHSYDEMNYDGKPYYDHRKMKGVIKFGFVGDDGFNYHHDLEKYVAWVTSTKVVSLKGTSFNLELLENRGGVQFFKMTRDMIKVTSRAVPRMLNFSSLKDYYLVTFYDIDVSCALGFKSDKGGGKNPWDNGLSESNMVMMKFLAPKKLVNKCSEFVRASVEDKFKPESVYGFLRSLGTRTVFSNSVVEENHGLSIKELAALSLVIYISTYESKFRDGKTLQNVMKAISYQRSSFYGGNGFWGRWRSSPPVLDTKLGWFEMLILRIFGKGPYAGGCIDVSGMLVDLDFSVPLPAVTCGYGDGVPLMIYEDDRSDVKFEEELTKLVGEVPKKVRDCDYYSWHSTDGFKETSNSLVPRIVENETSALNFSKLLRLADTAGAVSQRGSSVSREFVFRMAVVGESPDAYYSIIKERRNTPVLLAESDLDLAIINVCGEINWVPTLMVYHQNSNSSGRLVVCCRSNDTVTLTSVLRYVAYLYDSIIVTCEPESESHEVLVSASDKRHGLKFPSKEPNLKKCVYRYAQDLLKSKLLRTRDSYVGVMRDLDTMSAFDPDQNSRSSTNMCMALMRYEGDCVVYPIRTSHDRVYMLPEVFPELTNGEEDEKVTSVMKVSGEGNNCAYRACNNNRNCDYNALRQQLRSLDDCNSELREETEPCAEAGDAMMSVFAADRMLSVEISYLGTTRVLGTSDYQWRVVSVVWKSRHYDLLTKCDVERKTKSPYPSLPEESLTELMRFEPRLQVGALDEHPFTLVNKFFTDCCEHDSCFSEHMNRVPETNKRNFFIGERVLSKVYCGDFRTVKRLDTGEFSLFEILNKADMILLPPPGFTNSDVQPTAEDASDTSSELSSFSDSVTLSDYHKVQIVSAYDEGLFSNKMQVTIKDFNSSEIVVLTEDGRIREYIEMCDDVRASYSRFEGKVVHFLLVSEYTNIGRIAAGLQAVGKSVQIEITPSPDKYFSPKYIVDVDLRSLVYNAMEEQRALWSYEATVVTESLSREFDRAERLLLEGGDLNCFVDNSMCVYDTKNDRFALRGKGSKKRHQWGYSKSGLVNTSEYFASDKKREELRNSWCDKHPVIVFNSKSVLVHGIKLNSMYGNMKLTGEIPPLHMIQGVPGAGKSYTILQRNKGKPGNLILTVTREARDDLRRRAKASEIGVPEERIRTVDSFLLTPMSDVDEVWLDEALLKHVGSWYWIATLSKCSTMYVVGDKAQIPYIERSGVKVRYSLPSYIEPDEYLNVTRRCPLDITTWMNARGYYDCKVTSTSEVAKSVKGKIIEAVAEIPRDKDTKYLTFTQTEKEAMLKEGYDCSTVHEYQGNQSSSIALVRLTPKESNQIYKSKPHILVALTRHTGKFVYYTVLNDAVMKEVEYLESLAVSDVTGCAQLKGGGDPRVVMKESYENNGLKITRSVKEESAATIYFKDKLVVSLLHDHGNTSALGYTVNTDYEYEQPDISVSYNQESPVVVLQCWLDMVLPGSSLYDRHYDHELFEINDFNTHLQDVTLGVREPRHAKYDRMRPVLRSSIQPPVLATQRQIVKGFLERNGNVPILQGDVDEYRIAETMFEDFKELCTGHDYRDREIITDYDSLERWLDGQPTSVRNVLSSADDSFWDKDVTVYDFMLKNVSKPDLDAGAESRYKSPQTIAHQSKLINAMFCPILKEFMERVQSTLPHDILLYNNMTPDCFAAMLSERLPLERLERLSDFTEIDFSKYDKSQGLSALYFEVMVLKHYGVSDQHLKLWVLMHKLTTLINRKERFIGQVEYQRKSGDAGTWRLNTLLQLAVLNSEMGLHMKVKNGDCVGCFSGDDSVIFMVPGTHFKANDSQRLSFKYNLEAKLLNFRTPYFCSKFLIATADGWLFVPDLVKMIVKLGRYDLVDEQHVEEYRISFLDNLRPYANCLNWDNISAAVNDRFKISGEHSLVFRALLSLASNKKDFQKLYLKPEKTGCFSNRPNLDI